MSVTDSNIGLTAASMLEEMMEITGQNLVRMEVEDHYKFIKQLGKGKYGQVTLVIHRQRGNYKSQIITDNHIRRIVTSQF